MSLLTKFIAYPSMCQRQLRPLFVYYLLLSLFLSLSSSPPGSSSAMIDCTICLETISPLILHFRCIHLIRPEGGGIQAAVGGCGLGSRLMESLGESVGGASDPVVPLSERMYLLAALYMYSPANSHNTITNPQLF